MSGRFAYDAVTRELMGEPSSVAKGGRELRFGSRGSVLVDVCDGVWFDFEAGAGGGMLDLAIRQLGGNRSFAVAWLKRRAVEGFESAARSPAPKPTERASAATRAERAEAARRLWVASTAPAGTPVARYLASRGITLPDGAGAFLRFHPSVPMGPHGRLAAALALIRNAATGKPQAIQRIALTAAGERVRDGSGAKLAKMMLGPAAGGVVMLSPNSAVESALAISEGVETGLAALQRFPHVPVWAALSAGGMASFDVLPAVDHLTIYADADAAGIAAARTCAARWAKAGRWWRIVQPAEAGQDFADMALEAAA
jgi:putative DNA primase/helicase